MSIEQIAKIAHEVNRIYCETLGDTSQPKWEDAPEWQKESAVKGVKFHIENPNSTPEDSHNSWLEEKKKDGWKYGKVKNAEKKTHPCFVSYEKLPKAQQAKDKFFLSVVRAAI